MSDADKMRGIQGVEKRLPTPADRQDAYYENLIDVRHNRTRNNRTLSDDNELASSDFNDISQNNASYSTRELGDIFKKGGIELSESEQQEALGTKLKDVPSPSFPYFIFTIALIKDIVDVVVTVTVIGIVISMALSFLCALILFIWTMGKLGVSGGKLQKKRVQGILIKYGLSTGIEFIPGINVIPTTTIFVLLTYLQEAKISKLHKFALSKIQRRAGIR